MQLPGAPLLRLHHPHLTLQRPTLTRLRRGSRCGKLRGAERGATARQGVLRAGRTAALLPDSRRAVWVGAQGRTSKAARIHTYVAFPCLSGELGRHQSPPRPRTRQSGCAAFVHDFSTNTSTFVRSFVRSFVVACRPGFGGSAALALRSVAEAWRELRRAPQSSVRPRGSVRRAPAELAPSSRRASAELPQS